MLLGGPRWHQDGASRHQDAQDDAKRAPDGSTTGEVGAKIDPRSSKHKNIEKHKNNKVFWGVQISSWGVLGVSWGRLEASWRRFAD